MEIKNLRAYLKQVEFNFEEPTRDCNIELRIYDYINISEIKEEMVYFDVIREIKFVDLENSYIKVIYKNNAKCTDLVTKQNFIEYVKAGSALLTSAIFTKISLLIANITNQSSLGAIVTPPTYNLKDIEIN